MIRTILRTGGLLLGLTSYVPTHAPFRLNTKALDAFTCADGSVQKPAFEKVTQKL